MIVNFATVLSIAVEPVGLTRHFGLSRDEADLATQLHGRKRRA
jgi:hypothetical protein